MASPISKTESSDDWQGRTVSHDDFASSLAERRKMVAEPDMPRNSGNRRTASKRALLSALERLGASW